MSQSRVLITGGSGFIGTNLVQFYLDKGDVEVLNIDFLSPRNVHHRQYWKQIDIACESDLLKKTIKEFDPHYIFHLAARTDLLGLSVEDYSANTTGVHSIIKIAKNLPNLRRIGFASSRLVCKIGYIPSNSEDYCPTTVYGESKVLGERIVYKEADSLPEWFMFRPTSIWGPWFGVPYLNFFMSVYRGHYLHPLGCKIKKSFGFVGNSVFQLDKLMHAPVDKINKKTFYLNDYPALELDSWSRLISDKMDAREPFKVPLWLLKVAAYAGDFLKLIGFKNPPITSFRLANIMTDMVHDTDELKAICGELPFDNQDGVEITVNWLKENGYIKK